MMKRYCNFSGSGNLVLAMLLTFIVVPVWAVGGECAQTTSESASLKAAPAVADFLPTVGDEKSINVSLFAAKTENLKEVNEPGTMVLVGVCVLCMATYAWRKRKRAQGNVKNMVQVQSH